MVWMVVIVVVALCISISRYLDLGNARKRSELKFASLDVPYKSYFIFI